MIKSGFSPTPIFLKSCSGLNALHWLSMSIDAVARMFDKISARKKLLRNEFIAFELVVVEEVV